MGEIYRHLGEWLETKSGHDVETRYTEIGARRAAQGVPLSQLTWTIILTKENLWEFLKRETLAEDLREVLGELEMLQLLDQFFDRAIYYGAIGFERFQAFNPFHRNRELAFSEFMSQKKPPKSQGLIIW